VNLDGNVVLNSLTFIALFFYLLPVGVSHLSCLLVLHCLNQLVSGRPVARFFALSQPYIFETFRENLLILAVKLIHQRKERTQEIFFSQHSFHSIFLHSAIKPSKPIRQSQQPTSF